MTEASADTDLIHTHLVMLGKPVACTPELQLEIAWGAPETGPRFACLFRVDQLSDAARFAVWKNGEGHNVYVGTTIKVAHAARDRRTSASDAALATCVAIDVDAGLVEAARRLPVDVKPRLMAVSGTKPTLRGHLWIGLHPTTDLVLVDEVSARVIAACGGDMAARGRGRVMRLAGTVSFPPAQKKQKGYVIERVAGYLINAPNYSLQQLASAFPQLASVAQQFSPCTGYQGSVAVFPRADVQRVRCALAALPAVYAESYDYWIRVGLALHSFDPGSRGLALWKEFSERCPSKAGLTDFERRWASFGRNGDRRPITTRWLFAQSRMHGCRPHETTQRGARRR